MDKDNVTITLPKDCVIAFLVAGTNYLNRIKYLEENKKISDYKLRRLKNTNVYDLKNGMDILNNSIGGKYNGGYK